MTAFEDFVNLELPRRPTLLTNAITSYDGNPNLSVAAIINDSPHGTLFLEETTGALWQKQTQADPLSWTPVADGSSAGLATTGELHVYVDGTGGDDTNDGLTVGTPKKTLAAARALLPLVIQHNTTLHITGSFSGESLYIDNIMRNYPYFLIDGGDALTVVSGPFTSTALETDTTKIGDSGQAWTVDEFAGDWVEVTSGPAAGTMRTIQGNSATEITPCYKWTVDPGPGASFRVVRPATTLAGGFITFAPRGTDSLAQLQRLYLDNHALLVSGTTGNVTHCIQDNIGAGFVALWLREGAPAILPGRNDPDTYAYVSPLSGSACGLSCKSTNADVEHAYFNCGLGGMFASFFTNLSIQECYTSNWSISGGSRIKGPIVCYGISDGRGGDYQFLFGDDDANPTRIDNAAGVGLLAVNSILGTDKQAGAPKSEINNCGSHAIELQRSQWVDVDGMDGSGNTGAGIYAHSHSAVHIKDGSPPTLTGTVGDLAVSNPAAEEETWANIDAGTKVAVAAEMTIAKEVA
jgi:hypothetical protein